MPLLQVNAQGVVTNAEEYFSCRSAAMATRLTPLLKDPVVVRWLSEFTPSSLCTAEGQYEGHEGTRAATEAAMAIEMKIAESSLGASESIIEATENFILLFCGFSATTPPTRYLTNALHFQYDVDMERLMSIDLPLLQDVQDSPADVKSLFDDVSVCSAELLLRTVTEDYVANPFSPGQPMGKLLKLPKFAQCILVLINSTEAAWYQAELPHLPLAINVYASLMDMNAPISPLVSGARVIEVMELTKGCERGQSVEACADCLRENGFVVLLDDFDEKHPASSATASGVKVSVFANAFHSLQAFKGVDNSGAPLLPFTRAPPRVQTANPRAPNLLDYYGQLLPTLQPTCRLVVMEGSENCLKAEVSPGPPLNFAEPTATLATAHVYRAAALTLASMAAEGVSPRMVHQGGRALYAHESFDADVTLLIAALGKSMPAARTSDAGTMSWLGTEAVRRAAMQSRGAVSGLAVAP